MGHLLITAGHPAAKHIGRDVRNHCRTRPDGCARAYLTAWSNDNERVFAADYIAGQVTAWRDVHAIFDQVIVVDTRARIDYGKAADSAARIDHNSGPLLPSPGRWKRSAR
jgi:hypothetical protein